MKALLPARSPLSSSMAALLRPGLPPICMLSPGPLDYHAAVKSNLRQDLSRAESLAFAAATSRRRFIERFHRLLAPATRHPDYASLEKLYAWALVPLSLWPVDVSGLGLHLLACIEAARDPDPAIRLQCRLLPDAPAQAVCGPVSEYEHNVKTGSYESLIQAQHKFDFMELDLANNPALKRDWDEIKSQFDVRPHRNAAGVVRRRLVQERNFRPPDWKFSCETERQRFANVFDAFCHKWDLYGMQRDQPLLLKLTVSITPHGTIIMVPKYWSFDPRRDLKWKAIKRLHQTRSAKKQGVKLSLNQAERRLEATRARQLWQQAAEAGLKGDRRSQWVMRALGWDPRTDESRLRRALKG